MMNPNSHGGLLPTLLAVFVLVHAAVASLHGVHHAHHVHHVQRSPNALEAKFEETKQLLEKRASYIKITGVTGTVQPRLEIRDLKKNADQWNLFLLGMQRFMAKPKSDPLSFYQVTGVHGRPFVAWNNFQPINQAGFCPHSQILFGSWHRPYLALYEQVWYQNVLEVIATFPTNQQQRWKNAAATLRMPYWDWAKVPPNGEASTPTSIRDKTVTVTTPSGQQTIDNPLYSYNFGTVPSEMGGLPWNNFPVTLRRPVANPTRSNNNELATVMNQRRINMRDRLYGIFSSGASWGDVSTSAIGVRTSQNGNNVDSFESIHDIVHTSIGGESGGNMYYLDISSFDPIFWLHHTNMDRLLALYQVISPNTYVTAGKINRPMAQWNAGEPKNSYTPLKPFTKDTAGNYFTSEDIRNTRVLGYVYPETNGNPTAASVRSAINSLYGPSAPSKKRHYSTGPFEGRPFRHGDQHTVLSVIANKYALDGSYVVDCFLGHSNSTKNMTSASYDSPDYVGSYGVLGMMKADRNSSNPVMTEGCLPLTTALQGKQISGELKSMSPQHIEAYLKDNLKCKVIGPGGAEIPAEQVPDLHFYVKSCPVTPASSPEELPTWGEFEVLPEVTKHWPKVGETYTYPKPAAPAVPASPESPSYGTPSVPHGTVPVAPPMGTSSPPANSVVPLYPTSTPESPFHHPSEEPGYCQQKITIKYVDEAGNFLYSEEK
ncbi:Di-copper centre-containing protein [Delitschia confertaspora ATCC 74209]|uniref:tyrosinase n=1 Tax=Delitschia confertaspora ATCC 74209 TaxID=1513339 RepID=A0A9P4JF56_9PLEO|nr:Di-copper centre-containing protein [Delitschia confertaspora ATCC 74209]